MQNEKLKAVNRIISLLGDQANAVEMHAKNGYGFGILHDIEFDSGIIEVELLGENNPVKSFIGIVLKRSLFELSCGLRKNPKYQTQNFQWPFVPT